jgi:hypothetical protein
MLLDKLQHVLRAQQPQYVSQVIMAHSPLSAIMGIDKAELRFSRGVYVASVGSPSSRDLVGEGGDNFYVAQRRRCVKFTCSFREGTERSPQAATRAKIKLPGSSVAFAL